MAEQILIQPITPQDREWIRGFLRERWGSIAVVSRGQVYYGDRLPGFIARKADTPVGLITYHIDGDQCEIVTIDSLTPGIGIGSALIAKVHHEALSHACTRLWLITTNDNLPALRFYQRRGFRIVAVYPGAMENSRKLKPGIPLTGIDGIPIQDEIELEMRLR